MKDMKLPIGSLSLREHEGKLIQIAGMVDSIAQTSGPTLFSVVDGTGTLVLKGFEGPGVRAYPEIREGSAIQATVKIREFQDVLEGEIFRVVKLEGQAALALQRSIHTAERQRATVTPLPFLVQNPLLDKLKPLFIKAATEIRLAIIRNRPIIVRHHNDADGYSAGFAMERAILPLITKQHGGGKAPWEYYTRAPSAAPFYEIEDSIKDAAFSLSDVAKFSNKMPLVIIVDTGSGEESLLGIKQGKIHGSDFIVVDHHYFEKDITTAEVLVHINPFVVGEDGATFSAGMLCTELARFINPDTDISYIAALAGLADRIDNPQAINAYLKLAEKRGYTLPFLYDLAALIDFVSTKLRFMEAREYIETVFGEPIEKQRALVALMAPYIRALEARSLAIAKAAAQRERISTITLQLLDIETTFSRNTYPKPGKTIGLLHDEMIEKEKLKSLISVGVMNDLITIRATDETLFSIHDFIAYLTKHAPQAFAEGGGHHQAGAIRFVPSQKDAVLAALRAFLSQLSSSPSTPSSSSSSPASPADAKKPIKKEKKA